ncbi:nicotinate-nucleotide adenylyltransferase [Candidatus Chloroploca sp. M-50]|uniref:Probable nicotinate-nucleotide adenylyltransferase n=1 Tax=Candidatus Chloroploca mongolica TaxID=2528176 RepID=A0ABS4D8U6_9CHLR|nr:nicotinate-nucleotide adenylyltransferase [Candidatus Chloroploca mongolica]
MISTHSRGWSGISFSLPVSLTLPQPEQQLPVPHLRRIGVYGGSFDPIHLGHLVIAEEARDVLGLDQVLFVPAARQPFKDEVVATPHHRLAMVRLACEDHPAFLPEPFEVERPPPSYTIATLEFLAQRYGAMATFWFILGVDAALELPRWHRFPEIARLTRFALMLRPGYPHTPQLLAHHLPATVIRTARLIEGPQLTISSRDLRQRISTGRSVRYQVPEPVRHYIEAHQLYCDASQAKGEPDHD